MVKKISNASKLKPQGVTFTEEEKKEIAAFARETGMSMSAYIRELTARDKPNWEKFMKEVEHLRSKKKIYHDIVKAHPHPSHL